MKLVTVRASYATTAGILWALVRIPELNAETLYSVDVHGERRPAAWLRYRHPRARGR